MNPILAIARRELRVVGRERSILAAIVVQLAVAGFSAFLAVGLLGLYDPDHASTQLVTRVGYVGSGGFESYLRGADNLIVQNIDPVPATNRFLAGDLGAVVQENVTANGTRSLTVLVPARTLEGTLIITQMRALILRYQDDLRAANQQDLEFQLREVPASPRASVPFGFLYGLILPLLLVTPAFLSGSWASDNLVGEVQHKTLNLLRTAPMGGHAIITGKILVPLALAPVQVAVWCLLLTLNHIPVPGAGLLLVLVTDWAAVLVAIGVVLAMVTRQQAAAQTAFALFVIAVGVVSTFFARDPFNLVALLGTDRADARAWLALGQWTLFGLGSLVAAVAWAGRRLPTVAALA